MAQKYQPMMEGHSNESDNGDRSKIQPQPRAPMQIVVDQQAQINLQPAVPPDDSILYVLACICCSCCGLSLMALTMHCVAQSLYEQGQANYAAAHAIWQKARSLRLAAVIATIVVLVLVFFWYFFWFAAMLGAVRDE